MVSPLPPPYHDSGKLTDQLSLTVTQPRFNAKDSSVIWGHRNCKIRIRQIADVIDEVIIVTSIKC